MNTNWLPILNVGMYGTIIGGQFECIEEKYIEDFKESVLEEAKQTITEIFNDDSLKNFHLRTSDFNLRSPQFYNYSNDWLEFKLEIDDGIVETLRQFCSPNDEFFKWAEKNYGSYNGFISTMPYTKKFFHQALQEKPNTTMFKLEKALAMIIARLAKDVDLEYYQEKFEEKVLAETDIYLEESEAM